MIVLAEFVKKLRLKQAEQMHWTTKGRIFTTTKTCKGQFHLMELNTQKSIEWKFHVDKYSKLKY